MLKEERQESIIRFLQDRNYCSAVLLSKTLYTSLPTIRRDLAELEKKGYIRRCRGGALLLDSNRTDIPFPFRLSTHTQEKSQLCLLAATLVEDGNVIFIDESTTTQHMVECIRHRQDLTVITNSIAVCNLLYQSNIKSYCTGGCLQNSSCSFVGRQAERYVSEFNVDFIFFSTSSLNAMASSQTIPKKEHTCGRLCLNMPVERCFCVITPNWGKMRLIQSAGCRNWIIW